jgi:hypothetical protein
LTEPGSAQPGVPAKVRLRGVGWSRRGKSKEPFQGSCLMVALALSSAAIACGGGSSHPSGTGGTHGLGGTIDILGMGGAGGEAVDGAAGGHMVDCPEAFPVPNPVSSELPRPVGYTDNGDGSVTDAVTGLVWEKTPAATIACPGSNVDPPGSCKPAEAAAYCASKGGAWRLPTRRELMTLVDYDIVAPGPTIDAAAFPGTLSQTYLTSSPLAGDPTQAWAVSFVNGNTAGRATTANGWVRCVSSKPTACPPAHYQVQADGSVLDAYTGLTWRQSQSTHDYTFSSAQTACQSPWRLPSPTELQTIVDDTADQPAIDLDVFPGTSNEGFWTGLAAAGATDSAWFVSFPTGSSSTTPTTALLRVRCVR